MSYQLTFMPEHPRADLLGFVGVHLLVMEEMLGRRIAKGEIVHHKDFHKPNNEPSNLQLMTRLEHQNIPAMQARFLVEHNLMKQFFAWWAEQKHQVQTDIQLAEVKLVAAENERLKMTIKQLKQQQQKGT
jgi:hypothetical protein